MANNKPIGVAYSDPFVDSVQYKTYTVAQLPAASSALIGTRAVVTDSNAASYTAGIGATVAAGGSTVVPVFCNGTNWLIG
jgi:hypothetical protein